MMCSVAIPKSCALKLRRVRTNRPVPVKRTSDKAICAITKDRENGVRERGACRDAGALSDEFISCRVAMSAGARPKRSVVNSDTTIVKPSTRELPITTIEPIVIEELYSEINAKMTWRLHQAKSRPRTTPATASRALSVRKQRITLEG